MVLVQIFLRLFHITTAPTVGLKLTPFEVMYGRSFVTHDLLIDDVSWGLRCIISPNQIQKAI